MSDTQSLFFFDVALANFDKLIENASTQEEKQRLTQEKQAILARVEEEDRLAILDLPSKKKF